MEWGIWSEVKYVTDQSITNRDLVFVSTEENEAWRVICAMRSVCRWPRLLVKYVSEMGVLGVGEDRESIIRTARGLSRPITPLGEEYI